MEDSIFVNERQELQEIQNEVTWVSSHLVRQWEDFPIKIWNTSWCRFCRKIFLVCIRVRNIVFQKLVMFVIIERIGRSCCAGGHASESDDLVHLIFCAISFNLFIMLGFRQPYIAFLIARSEPITNFRVILFLHKTFLISLPLLKH